MATVATQSIDLNGLDATYSAASGGGDKVTPAAGSFLHVKNGNAATCTVTIATPGTVGGLAVADRTVAIPTADEAFILLDPSLYRNSADGKADVTWSVTATVTFAVLTA